MSPPAPPDRHPPVSGLARWSLVARILNFWLVIVGLVAGIALGRAATREISASAGRLDGMGLARAGIVLSIISVILYTLALLVLIAACAGQETCFA